MPAPGQYPHPAAPGAAAVTSPVQNANPPGTVDPTSHEFVVPTKEVSNHGHIAEKWEKSQVSSTCTNSDWSS